MRSMKNVIEAAKSVNIHHLFVVKQCDEEFRDDWQKIWCLGVVVMASLLGKLRYQFLKESLDFVAVHRLRLVQVALFCSIRQSTLVLG